MEFFFSGYLLGTKGNNYITNKTYSHEKLKSKFHRMV